MQKVHLFVLRLLLMITLTASLSLAGVCPSGWEDRSGSDWCYQFSTSSGNVKSWTEAKKACELQHGGLLSIADFDERDWVISFMSNYIRPFKESWWLGLSRQSHDGPWRWDDGHGSDVEPGKSTSSLLMWMTGTDSSTQGNCMTIWVPLRTRYISVEPKDCSEKFKYICKKLKKEINACDAENSWELHANKCYKVHSITGTDTGYSWSEARKQCQLDESDLPSVHDKDTNTIVRDLVSKAADASFWLGLKSYAIDGGHEWRWTDETRLDYESWKDGKKPEVSAGQEDKICVKTTGSNVDGLWSGYSCDSTFGFVCARAAGSCATGWYQHRDSCYSINTRQISWDEASDTCKAYGGNLIQIKQKHTQDFINSIKDDFVKQNIDYIWIGIFSQHGQQSELTWSSGGAVSRTYTNWAEGQPIVDPGRANAVRIVTADDTGSWEVANPVSIGGFVCELPLGQQPIPPTTPYPMYTCTEGWSLYGKSCYKAERSAKNWLEAEGGCKEDYPGSALVDIRDASEQEFVQGMVQSGYQRDYWIGLHNRKGNVEPRMWTWSVDESRASYFNWNTDEPNNHDGQENCVEMYYNGAWNDVPCANRLQYICKIPAHYDGSPPTTLYPATTTPEFDSFCGPGWFRDPLSDYCYQVNLDVMIWIDAKLQCEYQGGKLLSITTQTEKTYITGRLQSIAATNPGVVAFWMGFNDRAEEGVWVWDDESPVTYLNWANGEPNNIDEEDCGSIYPSSAQWNDESCFKRFPSVCKKRGNAPHTFLPNPTTIEVPDGHFRGCRDGYREFENMCYKIYSGDTWRKSWEDAKKQCRIDGGDLASVTDSWENTYLLELGKSIGSKDYWIGFQDIIASQRTMYFQWSDNSIPKYTNWNVHEPNNMQSTEDCVHVQVQNGGKWNDLGCETLHDFACKQRQIPILHTEPTTRPTGCPEGYDHSFEGYCLKFVVGTAGLDFNSAKGVCGDGATLATIPSQEAQNHFMLIFSQMNVGLSFWIGISRVSWTTHKWDDGRPVSYTNWIPNHNFYGNRGFMSSKTGDWDLSNPLMRLSNYICQVQQEGYTTTATTYNPAYCASGWVEAEGSCYRGFSTKDAEEKLTWEEARVSCKSLNGDLASVHSDEVTEKLKDTVGGTSSYWIGLNSRDTNKDYVWADGTPNNYYKWEGNTKPENLNNNLNCVHLKPASMEWTLDNCNAAKNWICQSPKGQYPTGTMPTSTAEPDIPECGDGWKYFNGACYWFNSESTDWYKSLRKCQEFNSDLVSIHSQEENDFLLRVTSKLHLSTTSYWIGLTELGLHDGFRWTDGTGVEYFNWNAGEPNNNGGAEHCVSMYALRGLWNDDQCGESQRFICKKRNDTTTPAPTTPMPGNCPKEFFSLGDKCYRMYETELKTWDDAKQFCSELVPGRRSYLASISNEYEQAALVAITGQSDVSLWIGLHARGNQHLYYWHDNSEVAYTNWDYNEPSSLNEQCVEMHREKYVSGKWNDMKCDAERGFLCMTFKDPNLVTAWPQPTSIACPSGWKPYGNACFKYMPEAATWEGAEATCSSKAANLVTILDVWEQNFVHAQTESTAKVSTWIGLSSRDNTEQYRWSNSWPVTYTNWASNEPKDEENGQCAYMEYSGRWYSHDCTNRLPYMCRIDYGTKPTLPPVIPGDCPEGFNKFRGSCYFFASNDASMTAQEAQYECVRRRTNLVSILDEDEQNFIANKVKEITEDVSYRRDYWIGLMRLHEGSFEWHDGEPYNYHSWSKGEPSNTDRENCVELYHRNLKWNDHFCSKRNSYICKTPVTPSTGQTTRTTRTTRTTARITTATTAATTSVKQTQRQTDTTIQVTTKGETKPETGEKLTGLRNDGIVLLVISICLVCLIVVIVSVFLFRRFAAPKIIENGFTNANWSRMTDSVKLDDPRPGGVQIQMESGVENPVFAT